jgi:H+/Cl- antiporter ClcA
MRRRTSVQAHVVAQLGRWIALGAASGALAGVASWVFLESLDWATETRIEQAWLVWMLPVAGLVIGLVHHRLGGRAVHGNLLLLDEIHEPTEWVPRRMAPLVYVGTVTSHLVGASVGREGAALQMSGSLTDAMSRALRLRPETRRLLLIVALAGGFGSVFGVPLAGTVFALEVQARGRVRYEALVPALTASLVGHLVVRGLGHEHANYPILLPDVDVWLTVKVAAAGLAFGVAAAAFIELVHGARLVVGRLLPSMPARPMIGGFATVALMALFGRDYLGLSLPLIDAALAGAETGWEVPLLKGVFTVVALGSLFPGGEVTPLFVIGATLGAALASPLGVDVPLLAALGFVAVFAGAANAPLACTIMAVELFGGGVLIPAAVACVASYVFSGSGGIYVKRTAR